MADSDLPLCQHGNPRHACDEQCTCGHPCSQHPIENAGGCAETKCSCRQFTKRPGPPSKVAQRAHD